MTEPVRMALALVAGLALGTLFFYGLWLTVRLTLASRVPALWVLGSFWLRAGSVGVGFYFVGRGGDWRALLACLVGFVAARYLVAAGTRPATPPTPLTASHLPHASQLG
jgi:F1F0 ATPase subunit 2